MGPLGGGASVGAVLGRSDSVSAPFSPADITGLQLWLDRYVGLYQDTAGTIQAANVGDPVGRWEDQSGMGRHATQATASKKPTVSAGGLLFDGADDGLSFSATGQGAEVSVFAVVQTNGSGPHESVFFEFRNSTTTTPVLSQLYWVGGQLALGRRNSSGVLVRPVSATNTNNRLLVVGARISTSTLELYEDSQLVASAAVNGSVPINYGSIGQTGTGAFSWSGDARELLTYDRFVSDPEKLSIVEYLAGKHNITL